MKKIWPFLFYFFFYVAASGFFPFAALYYQSLGLSGGQIGLLTGLAPLITLIGAPFWTGMADASHRHKMILNLTILGAAVSALIIPSIQNFAWLLPVVMLYAFL